MRTILRAADLHLDHVTGDGRDTLRATLRELPGQAVILTGDTSIAPHLVADLEFIADAVRRPVYLVLGNHDHYGSSVAAVRDAVAELNMRRPDITWLPPAGVVDLGDGTVLIGVDGWADGRAGDPLATPLRLNDDKLIAEIAAFASRQGKIAVKRELANGDAARLAVLLDCAVAVARHVIVATHVPPFAEALPTMGRLADPAWLPLLVCGATGAVLQQFAAAHPTQQFTVWCGHTHVAADVAIAPNLRCVVSGARYGAPAIESVDV
jgi:predicted MPP superfamily phosphohydrolase